MMKAKCAAAVIVMVLAATSLFPLVSASGTIYMRVHVPAPTPDLAISVDVTSIYFGTLSPGNVSEPKEVTITNIGSRNIVVNSHVSDNGAAVFVPGIRMDDSDWSDYHEVLLVDESLDVQITLHVPDDLEERGRLNGKITFWADEIVSSRPVADFSADVTSGDTPLTVQFTDLSSNGPTSWSWDFGDGNTSSEQSPSHVFSTAGTYSVKLTVSNTNGSDDEIKIGYITVDGDTVGLEADFSADVTYGIAPLTVQFTDLSTNAPTSWSWDFGDGTTSAEQSPSHTYADPGTYTVELTVTNATDDDQLVRSEYIMVTDDHLSEGSWELFHGDQQLTGYYDGDVPDSNEVKWVSDYIDAQPSSSVVIAEGKAFVYCYDSTVTVKKGYICALDLGTGALVWKKECLISNPYGSWATPAYHDGLVFTAGDGARYASNGTLLWGGLPDNTNGGPMVADGKVFIGNWDGNKYFAYDEKTGAKIWEFTVNGKAQGIPAYNEDRVFLTSYEWGVNGDFYCVNADTGTLVWELSSGDSEQSFCGSPCIVGGYVYVTTYNFEGDGLIYCLDESDGSEEWRQTIQRSDATPAFHDGKVYVTGGAYGYSDHQTYCFDALTGTLVWSTTWEQDIGGWTCSVVVADGKVFVGREGESSGEMVFGYVKLFALDADTGSEVWSYDGCGATVAICDGVVYSVGADGRVYAIGGS